MCFLCRTQVAGFDSSADGYTMGRSKVQSAFVGDTGLLVSDNDQSLPTQSEPNLSEMGLPAVAKSQREASFTPPPNFSSRNNGVFGMGRQPEENFDEVLLRDK
ncbi:unnamed protein product [Gongylonema pulchrum]|uniref:Ovule protein n=1 Tax=Gongylonema pulchrum TaxID=637853 RepID=A0A183EII4_9BILA|nr:unnamed protein product [Gongylonema pulchrum]